MSSRQRWFSVSSGKNRLWHTYKSRSISLPNNGRSALHMSCESVSISIMSSSEFMHTNHRKSHCELQSSCPPVEGCSGATSPLISSSLVDQPTSFTFTGRRKRQANPFENLTPAQVCYETPKELQRLLSDCRGAIRHTSIGQQRQCNCFQTCRSQ